MKLLSKVVFECYVHNVFESAYRFENLEELKKIVKDEYVPDISDIHYSMNIDITRCVIVSNRAKKGEGIIDSLNGVKVAEETITLVVTDKLIYPKDVRKILNKKYNSTFNLDKYKLDEKIPVKRFNVSEDNMTGMIVNGRQTHYTLYNVYCKQLTPNDVVIDKNLNQIWPKKTGAVPTTLTEMLSRTKEIIR
jgi:hypothetical protein